MLLTPCASFPGQTFMGEAEASFCSFDLISGAQDTSDLFPGSIFQQTGDQAAVEGGGQWSSSLFHFPSSS